MNGQEKKGMEYVKSIGLIPLEKILKSFFFFIWVDLKTGWVESINKKAFVFQSWSKVKQEKHRNEMCSDQ